MKLDCHFFHVRKLSEDQKKSLVFVPKSIEHHKKSSKIIQLSDAYYSHIIGEDADTDHSQIIGGDISPYPPGFRHPCPQIPK